MFGKKERKRGRKFKKKHKKTEVTLKKAICNDIFNEIEQNI